MASRSKMEQIEQLTLQLQIDTARYADRVDELTELVKDLRRSLAGLETWMPEKETATGTPTTITAATVAAATSASSATHAAATGTKPPSRFQNYNETAKKKRPHAPIVLVEESATESPLPDTVTVGRRKRRILRAKSATPELGPEEAYEEEEEEEEAEDRLEQTQAQA